MTGPITFEGWAHGLTLSAETRTITGTITVLNQPTTDYRRLVLHEGALRPRLPLSRVKLLRDHDARDPLGYMLSLAKDGVTGSFKVAPGENGDRALFEADPANKLRDGLSVGIQVLNEEGAFAYDEETDTYNVYAAELVEVSLCAIPAYQDAQVSSVKASRATEPDTDPLTPPTLTARPTKEKEPMTDTLTLEDLDAALAANAEEAERKLDARLASFAGAPAAASPTWANFGAFAKELAAGSTEARDFYKQLAYEGPTSADTAQANTWIGDTVRLVDKLRPMVNTFTRETLPAKGMTLEFLKLATNTMAVAEQLEEGDDLAFGKISLESDTTPVRTFGGYTQLPRQVIDRADALYVNTAFKAMDMEYARATEAAVRAVVNATIAAQKLTANKLTLPAGADAYDWLDLLVDAGELYTDLGYNIDGALVSKDIFKQLVRLEDTNGNMLMRVFGEGTNQTGTVDLTGLKGNLASVTFKLLPKAAPGTAGLYDAVGVTTWESAGAPFQLEDSNVVNLTKDFSKYGYLAAASQFPDAIVPIEIAAP